MHHSDVEYDNNINRENSQSSKHTTQPYITLIHTFEHSHIPYSRIRTDPHNRGSSSCANIAEHTGSSGILTPISLRFHLFSLWFLRSKTILGKFDAAGMMKVYLYLGVGKLVIIGMMLIYDASVVVEYDTSRSRLYNAAINRKCDNKTEI